jgi:hypothetical protein
MAALDRAQVMAGHVVDAITPKPGSGFSTPLDPDLEQSKYDFTQRVFPTDLGGTSYQGHWMVININVSTGSVYGNNVQRGGTPIQTFTKLANETSKLDALRKTIDNQYTYSGTRGQRGSLGYNGIFLPRFTRRIVESIALFMPPTMVFSTNNQYQDIGLTDKVIGWIQSGARIATGKSGFLRTLNNATNVVIDNARSLMQMAGVPINPKIEILFYNTDMRTFQFDFLMAPRDEEESKAMEQIIRTIRFHAAPELNLLSLGGLLWTPPSEFDITFMNAGQENTHIPRINTCALEQIDVDYAPSGVYSTFSNGHPVSVRMQLRFKELEVVHKLRVLQGF